VLLEHGANIEAKDRHGHTALILATIHGHTAIVQLLLERDAKIEAATTYFYTALRLATIHGHTAIVKLLLEHGANIDPDLSKYGNHPDIRDLLKKHQEMREELKAQKIKVLEKIKKHH